MFLNTLCPVRAAASKNYFVVQRLLSTSPVGRFTAKAAASNQEKIDQSKEARFERL
jgi:hypothetical protein